ncbi:MAG: ADP-ribosylation factor-like protein [Candidatus Nanohaloarchaea archaeon]
MKKELPIQRLNDATDGGVEEGSDVLLLVDLVIEKTEFSTALANHHQSLGDDVVYFLNNKMPKFIDEKLDEDRSAVIDGFSTTLGKESDAEFRVDADLNEERDSHIEESKEVIGKAVSESGAFFMDSLDPFVGDWDSIMEYRDLLKSEERINYYLLPNLGIEEGDDEYEKIKQEFDYFIHLKGLERSGMILKFMDVVKPDIETKIPFDITPTGIKMYVPKILVTGPQNSGKTTTVHNMSDSALSTEESGTTVALDKGQVDSNGVKADIFGTPGQKRFDYAIDFLGEGIFGSFIVVDSRDPDYERIEELKETLGKRDVPLIVLANFQNKEEAETPEKIEEELGIETRGIDAENGENLEESLERLIDKILEEHSWR